MWMRILVAAVAGLIAIGLLIWLESERLAILSLLLGVVFGINVLTFWLRKH